jgi:protein-S-isoprenylcysteine O-methyltransferase Ste14
MFFLKIVAGWIAYFALHSILAANAVKEKCRLQFPSIFPCYRIGYNFIAIGGLLLLAFWSFQDVNYLVQQPSWMKNLGFFFIALGVVMLGVAFASFNVKEFLGLKKEEHHSDTKLVTKGVYRYVRHPLYTGVFLLLPGVFLLRPTFSILLFVLITAIYIEIGSRLEEQKLIKIFGEDYVRYRNSVKRYFPFIY